MNDQTKHMLRMAAKAAGYQIEWHEDSKSASGFYLQSGLVSRRWSPIDDDGDAMRLAVKAQLSLHNDHKNSNCVWCTRSTDEDIIGEANGKYESEDEICEEDFSATRLAITRAAAAIGEAMP